MPRWWRAAWGKPCVAGCGEINISEANKSFTVKGRKVKEADWITIDGTTGDVMLGKLPLVQPELSGDFVVLVKWADAFQEIGVRTNADTPTDAAASMDFGAEGGGGKPCQSCPQCSAPTLRRSLRR